MNKIFLIAAVILVSAGCAGKPQDYSQNIVQNSTAIPAADTPQSQQAAQLPIPTKTEILAATTVGHVSRHPQNYINKKVAMLGYMLKLERGYAIISDESDGAIGVYDLPVSGEGVENLKFKNEYFFMGILRYKGLFASNNNQYHLELSIPPYKIK